MKQSRQDILRQKFNMFNYVLGETLENQMQRFITLTTEMSSDGVMVTKSKINKKLLNSLPKSWDTNVSATKKTKDLNRLSLVETMALIKACDLDEKQIKINNVNSYSCANLGIQTTNNTAFSSFFIPQVSQVSHVPQVQPYVTH